MRKAAVTPLLSVYAWLNRHRAFEVPLLRSLFVHSYFFYKSHFEDPFYWLVSARPDLFRRGHLLDVGANIGYTTVVFASALKSGAKIFAFEPERRNFDRLIENLSRFGVKDRVVAKCMAVGAYDGTVDIWLNELHPGDHRTVTRAFRHKIQPGDSVRSVPVVSIDSFVQSNHIANEIGFIKIDVQGYETEVCRGMERALATNARAVVAIEYAPGSMIELGLEPQALMDFFLERGFNLYELGRRGLRELPAGGIQVEEDEWINLLCSRERL